MRRNLLLAFIFCLPITVIAQPFFDVAHLSWQQSNSTLNNQYANDKLQTNLFAAVISAPLKIKKDNLVITLQYENQGFDLLTSRWKSVFSAGVPLTYVHQWKNDHWKTAFVFITRFNGFDDIPFSKNNLQFGGAVLNTFKKKENLKYKFGVYYNSEFFGPFFLPLLGIDWNISKKVNLFGVLPNSATLEYKINPHFHTGISARFITASYLGTNESFLRMNDNQPKLFFDYYFTSHHVISVEGGYTVLREFKNGVRHSGETTYSSSLKNDGYFFRIAYAFRMRLDE